MKTLFRYLFLLLTCLTTLSVAAEITPMTTFKVGVENVTYNPYYWVADGEYQGFVRDVLDEFAKSEHIVFQYVPLPIKRLHNMYLNGKLDFLYPDNPEWATDQKQSTEIYYSNPLVVVIDGAMVIPANSGKSLINIKKLGTITGYTAPAYQNLIDNKQVFLVEVNEFSNLQKMVISGRVDASYVSINPGLYQLREVLKKPDALVFDKNLPFDRANHQLSSINQPSLITRFNEFIISHHKLINTLKEKYKILAIDI